MTNSSIENYPDLTDFQVLKVGFSLTLKNIPSDKKQTLKDEIKKLQWVTPSIYLALWRYFINDYWLDFYHLWQSLTKRNSFNKIFYVFDLELLKTLIFNGLIWFQTVFNVADSLNGGKMLGMKMNGSAKWDSNWLMVTKNWFKHNCGSKSLNIWAWIETFQWH